MESSCPHLGADMSHADIEEADSTLVAVCPWHRYDFDLETGASVTTSLTACTYDVEVKIDANQEEVVYIVPPKDGMEWAVVECRPVSEEFADPPPPVAEIPADLRNVATADEPIVPETDPPQTLLEWAVLILNTPHPTLKVARTRHAAQLFFTGQLTSIGHKKERAASQYSAPPDVPRRETSMRFVNPTEVKSSRKKNRAVMLHALACIEQWAIDLAWDIMARFGPMHPDLPHSFFADFTKMAVDEAKHFTLLTSRLVALSPSTPYGSMPVHAALWESASSTAHSLSSRLAIIHLVHEARGLDVNPGTIERFRKAGDVDSVKVMEIIHADEVTHVTSGHRWFSWICRQAWEESPHSDGEQLDLAKLFREKVKNGWRGEVKGPFNEADRGKAGMTPEWYNGLKGEMQKT